MFHQNFCQTPVLGLGLGVDFTFAGDNDNKNHNHNNNPHLNFVKGTVLGDKEQGAELGQAQVKLGLGLISIKTCCIKLD